MKRSMIAVLSSVAVLCMAGTVCAGTYTQGFEGSGYNFYADAGCSSGVTTAVAHSGLQSAQFTLDATNQAYTRWKSEDLSSYGIKLKDLQASDWVMRSLGRSDLAPYLLFTVDTGNNSFGETMAIQFTMPTIADNTWTQNVIDRATTTFHVVGDRTGLGATEFSASGTQGTLNQLSAITYSGSTTWGDLPVTFVRVGVGLWDASQTYNGYADDVTVSGAQGAPVPEPAGLGLIGLALLAVRRRRS